MNTVSAEKIDQFIASAQAAAATVERVKAAPEDVAEAVSRAAAGATRIAVAEAQDLPAELLAACRALPGAIPVRSRSETAAADVGITEAFAGIARTGTVCIELSDGGSAYASLLPRLHIALLAKKNIVERPADLFDEGTRIGARGLRRNFVFVTGPSATADMGPLVRGVHGPHRLHLLILE